jgi:hypothetical protein
MLCAVVPHARLAARTAVPELMRCCLAARSPIAPGSACGAARAAVPLCAAQRRGLVAMAATKKVLVPVGNGETSQHKRQATSGSSTAALSCCAAFVELEL